MEVLNAQLSLEAVARCLYNPSQSSSSLSCTCICITDHFFSLTDTAASASAILLHSFPCSQSIQILICHLMIFFIRFKALLLLLALQLSICKCSTRRGCWEHFHQPGCSVSPVGYPPPQGYRGAVAKTCKLCRLWDVDLPFWWTLRVSQVESKSRHTVAPSRDQGT